MSQPAAGGPPAQPSWSGHMWGCSATTLGTHRASPAPSVPLDASWMRWALVPLTQGAADCSWPLTALPWHCLQGQEPREDPGPCRDQSTGPCSQWPNPGVCYSRNRPGEETPLLGMGKAMEPLSAPARMGQGVEGPQAGMTVRWPRNSHRGGSRDGCRQSLLGTQGSPVTEKGGPQHS